MAAPVHMKRLKGPNQRGVKLHHPTLRNCIWTIQQPAVAYPEPFPCPLCQVTHIYKTFHLNLDSAGNVTVHEAIYELFRDNGIVGEMNATRSTIPRPTVLQIPGAADPVWQPPIVVSREDGVVKAPGMNNAVKPPPDRFRQNADGTWTDLERNPHG